MLTRVNRRDDQGFTLIELLVVVAIIGILAAIAIPVFINQRNNAANSGAEAELKNAATQLEVYYTENGDYPANAAAVNAIPVNVSDDVAMFYTYTAAAGAVPASYMLTGCNVQTQLEFTWDSTEGTFTGTPAVDAVNCVAANASDVN
ncbi:MAG: prepilin-type N-terminal cleavage/methylation domain-containing protein [Actinomycetota bacterium]|nr:prepilin-type N-terminal cleavage/methylation domain-containing protein [Actinomycetota bacterium]